jgi:hypothetical protein
LKSGPLKGVASSRRRCYCERMNRIGLTVALAALFALAGLLAALKREWLEADLAGLVAALAMIALYRRRTRPDT